MKKKLTVAILLCLCLLLCACGQNEAPAEPQHSEQPQPETPKTDWQVAFEYVLSVGESSDDYLLYDLDADGEPEMITRVGSTDDIEYYTYDWMGNGSVTKAYVFSGKADLAGLSSERTLLFCRGEDVYKLVYADGAGKAEKLITKPAEYDGAGLELLPVYNAGDLSGMRWNGDPTDANDAVLKAFEEAGDRYVEGPGDKPTYEGELIDWISAYKNALGGFGSYNGGDIAQYGIYDLDDDNVPEMLCIFGGSSADLAVYVIDAKFGGIVTKTKVLDGSANAAGLSSENAMLLHKIHMGTETVYKIVYKGAQYKVETVVSRSLDSASDALRFEYLSMFDFDDKDGIYWPGNREDNNAAILSKVG